MNEELDHQSELERLDRTTPGWDDPGSVAVATLALRNNIPREVLVAIYGVEIVTKAEAAMHSLREQALERVLLKALDYVLDGGLENEAACAAEGDWCLDLFREAKAALGTQSQRLAPGHGLDVRTKCECCGRWMRYATTTRTPATRRRSPHADRCMDCPASGRCASGCNQCRSTS